jgi:hypothetical protein
MRRSLSVASAVALVATLLTATPAAADDLGRVRQPVLRAPADVDGAEAVVAPVSEDAHPVETEVELISFGTEPAEGTPEAVEAEEPGATEPEWSEPESPTPTDEAEPATPSGESANSEASEGSDEAEPADEVQNQSATTSSAMTSLAVTDEPTAEGPVTDEPSDWPSDEGPATEAPADSEITEVPGHDETDVPSDDATEESEEPATEEPATEEPATEDDHEGHDHEGHDHAEESGEDLATQLYASTETPELSVVGVTWDLATAPADLVVEMRTLTDDEWSAWEPMHVEELGTRDDEAEVGARDGTTPTAVIGASAVEVRLASDTTLPAEPSLALVDPGESSADSAPVTTAAMTTAATSRPTIYSRAQWGADESKMTWNPSQGRVQGIDIHHTVNANDYTASQVPALMRSIYAYHAEDWGRGWGDIGYNFIVDRFGRIWEGRYGGVDQAPIGAHATGLNSNFSGISLLGNFDTAPVPAATFTSVARLAAWKLAMHGITTANGTVTVDAGTFNRINGHRDSKQTTCPGRYMYNRLGEMRTRINSYIGSFADRYLDRDLDGDGRADLLVNQGGRVYLASTVDRGTWTTATIGTGWSQARTVSPGDIDGNGHADMLLIDTAGRLRLYPGVAGGGVTSQGSRVIGTGWGSFNSIVGGDWNGDRKPDLIARSADGRLWLYAGDGKARFARAKLIGVGWNAFSSISLAPAFASGRPALVTEASTGGGVYAYPSNGRGGFGTTITIGTGWASMDQTTGVGDATGDGHGDVVAVDKGGRLWLYPGTGNGRVDSVDRVPFGTGWSTMRILPTTTLSGESMAIVAVRADAKLLRYGYSLTRPAWTGLADTGIRTSSSTSAVLASGDWNGDGRPDIMVVTTRGALMLHTGLGGGRFSATGQQIGNGWASFSSVMGAGNWRGDGKPGLLAHDSRTGQVWYYPGTGTGGFGTRVLVSTGASGMNTVINAGRLDSGGAPDLLMRGADTGRLFFADGNGPGLALPPRTIGPGWSSFSAILGLGDVTGDGRADLVGVTSTGTILVYRGNGAGGFLSPTTMGTLASTAVVS